MLNARSRRSSPLPVRVLGRSVVPNTLAVVRRAGALVADCQQRAVASAAQGECATPDCIILPIICGRPQTCHMTRGACQLKNCSCISVRSLYALTGCLSPLQFCPNPASAVACTVPDGPLIRRSSHRQGDPALLGKCCWRPLWNFATKAPMDRAQ